LQERIIARHLINQGVAGLCGPAAFLFDLAVHNPVGYAEFGINLFERGSARLRNLEVKPSQSLKDTTPPAGINQADWLLMASIRNSENTPFFDYVKPSDEFSGITVPGEMAEWLSKTGYTRVVDTTSKLFTQSLDNAREARSKYDDDWTVFLFINAQMLDYDTEHMSSLTPDHWVMLESNIDIQRSAVRFQVYTWGLKHLPVPEPYPSRPPRAGLVRQPRHDFPPEMFLKNYYGFVAGQL